MPDVTIGLPIATKEWIGLKDDNNPMKENKKANKSML